MCFINLTQPGSQLSGSEASDRALKRARIPHIHTRAESRKLKAESGKAEERKSAAWHFIFINFGTATATNDNGRLNQFAPFKGHGASGKRQVAGGHNWACVGVSLTVCMCVSAAYPYCFTCQNLCLLKKISSAHRKVNLVDIVLAKDWSWPYARSSLLAGLCLPHHCPVATKWPPGCPFANWFCVLTLRV